MFYNRRMKEFQAKNRRDPTEAELGELYAEASKDAEFAALGKTKIEPTPGRDYADPMLELLIKQQANYIQGSPDFERLQREIDRRMMGGAAGAAPRGPSVEERILAGLEKGGAFGAPAPKRELPATIQRGMTTTPAAPRPSAQSTQKALGIMSGGLPPEIAEKIRSGKPLTPQEQILLQEAKAAERARGMSH
jgi:hypothetical protein